MIGAVQMNDNIPKYVIIGWNPEKLTYDIYHWDNWYDHKELGILSQLKHLKDKYVGINFSVLVNIHHFENHINRDKLLDLLKSLK